MVESCWISVLGQLLPAHWALVVVLQPGLDAIWVEGVAAWEEHSFLSHLEVRYANRASRCLKSTLAVFLAVLLFYLLHWQLIDDALARRPPSIIRLPLHVRIDQVCKALEAEPSVAHAEVVAIADDPEDHVRLLLPLALTSVAAPEVLLVAEAELTLVKEAAPSTIEEWITEKVVHHVHVLEHGVERIQDSDVASLIVLGTRRGRRGWRAGPLFLFGFFVPLLAREGPSELVALEAVVADVFSGGLRSWRSGHVFSWEFSLQELIEPAI